MITIKAALRGLRIEGPHHTMKKFVYVLILSLWLGQNVSAKSSKYYDEIYDNSGGLRPEYANVYPELLKRTKTENSDFRKRSKRAYKGDNALNDVPLIISAEEFDSEVVAGVDQRARAILEFLADDFSGAKSYREIVSPTVIDRIRARNGEMRYSRNVSPNNIAFFYGPDLMRNSKGETVVLEDNGGNVGLAFDLRLAHKLMLENNPEILRYVKPRNPEEFYRKLVESYKARGGKYGGKTVLLMSAVETDSEDQRLRKIYSDYGVEVIYPSARDKKLVALEHGVYTYSKSKGVRSMEKVGFVILAGEHAWYDNTHPAARERAVIEETKSLLGDKSLSLRVRRELTELLGQPYSTKQIKALAGVLDEYDPDLLKPTAYPGLVAAIMNGLVGTNNTPGTEFASDKELYIYMEDFIRFYLHEEPILKNQRTWSFATAAGELHKGVFDRCFADFSKFVLKAMDGRGGDGVFVGPNTKRETISKLKTLVKANPTGWECQEYMSPSRLGDLIIDRRAIANAFLDNGKTSVIVSNVSASRGNSPTGSGKVNLSGNGRAVTVLINESCEKILSAKGRHSVD